MSIKLYFGPGACSFVPHTMLEEAGAQFEPMLIKLHKGEHQTPEFKALNPRGQVPVLVDGDQVITQILAIVTHLEQRFPQCGFLPTEPMARMRAMETLAWMNNTAHPTFTHVFMPFKFASTPETQAEIKAHNTKLFAGMLQELDAIVQKSADAGQPFLGGARFGPLDAYALTLLRWGSIAKIDPTGYKALWAHVQKVAQLPSVQRAMERERLVLNLYQPAS